ncbi:MAG TPA: D-Ala-D-Ala carboxypeptidase family metallohydrolase [Polyangiales bacterium]|nr:D-Ala-D-Ala carboxypeptidase family metallohydrolase [Polyangiales bacterium]
MNAWWCALLVLGSVALAQAQSSADQEPLDVAAPKEAKPDVKPASADVARRERRQARKKVAEQATGPAQSSSVEPEHAKKVEPPAQEKSAATETAIETIASSPSATKVARKRASEPKPSAPKHEKKKTAYDIAREKWHADAPPEMCAQFKATAIPDLVFQIQGKDVSYVLRPQGRNGGWTEDQLAIAKEAFGSWPGGPTPHPRTLDLVYAATLHFGCPYVTLISGIRKDRGGSRHSHGLAADIVLPGVEDEELAAYFRAQGFVGVGTYPRAGFTHVDTRDQSFFWVDRSKPNQHGRVVQVRKEESTAVDEAARARGMGGFVNPPRLQKALRVRAVRKLKAHRAKLEAKQPAP